MDMTESIAPRSDQVNADDLIAGPITYTIREVIAGAAEHPFDFQLVETPRAYRPSKTMRRVIVAAWGSEAANYAGRRLTLYREPSITYAGVAVGGIRVSHMSHISGPVEVMAQTARGKRERFTVRPLPEIAPSAAGAAAASGPPPAEAVRAAAATPQPPVTSGEGAGATAGNGPSIADQLSAMGEQDFTDLRARVPIPSEVRSTKKIGEITGEWSTNLARLLEQLRRYDCTLAELPARIKEAVDKFQEQVDNDTLPPTASQERLEAGNPKPGEAIPMYGPGAPA